MSLPSSLSRRCFSARLAAGAACAISGLGAGLARAADLQPIRILVGFPAGGGSDVIARTLGEKLHVLLGRPVLVDNRPGAGGQIAAQQLKSATPDGTTLFLTHDHTISILPQVVKTPGFNPGTDFVPVGGFASFVNCLAVSPGTPAKNMADYVAWVHAHGNKSAIGIPAPASTPEFLVQMLGKRYGLDLVAAPYRGSAPMLADMLGNQIPAGIGSVQDFIENHRAGKVRVIGVLGGKRQAALPDVPTFNEMGLKGMEDMPYYGIFAPKGTPAEFIATFTKALAKVLTMPDVRKSLTDMGLTVDYMTPQQLTVREKTYTRVWSNIIRESGFKPQ